MKYRLLDMLVCPGCAGYPLQAEDFVPGPSAEGADELREGLLRCPQCGHCFPVIAGIPRLLAGDLAAPLRQRHSAFFDRYEHRFPATEAGTAPADRQAQEKRRTMKSFGFQWTKFGELHPEFEEHFRVFIAPAVTPAFFSGKLGLDAGCGFGRHSFYASKWGAEMVSLDLSDAVESAYANNHDNPRVHVVQGDIYHPPFRDEAFDFIYSLGVLHHLPDPERGFRSLLPKLKPGFPIFLWLYSGGKGKRFQYLEPLRRAVSRLPFSLLNLFCLGLAAAGYAGLITPYRGLNRLLHLEARSQRIPGHFRFYARYPFRVYHADWFDRLSAPVRFYYSRDEARAWYERVGYEDVQVEARYSGWNVFGVKPVPAGQKTSGSPQPELVR